MLNALADGVNSRTRLDHKRKGRIEGQPEAGWMVLDYGSIVVHLFDEQMRRYFKLEELWIKGKVILHVQ
jgi:ribosome-associated protein